MGYILPEAIAIGYGNELRSDDGIAAIKREIHCCPPTYPRTY
ncbi:hypothetical protein [Nostoc sp.]